MKNRFAKLSIAALIAGMAPGPAMAEEIGCNNNTCSEWCWRTLWWSPDRGFYWGVGCRPWKVY